MLTLRQTYTRFCRKVPRMLLVVTALVKEMRGEAKVTLPWAYCISLPHDTTLWTHSFYTSAFTTSCLVLSAMDDKIKQCVWIKFCVTLSKSATKTLEMLYEAFGEHSLSWRVVTFPWARRHHWDQEDQTFSCISRTTTGDKLGLQLWSKNKATIIQV
jgi:hypothetical protein